MKANGCQMESSIKEIEAYSKKVGWTALVTGCLWELLTNQKLTRGTESIGQCPVTAMESK